MEGNKMKLKVLLQNLNRRYMRGDKKTLRENLQRSIAKKGQIQMDGTLPANEVPLSKFDSKLEKSFLHQLKKFKLKAYIKHYQAFIDILSELKIKAKDCSFDTDFKDEDGMTPLHYSCQNNNPDCTHILLLENGASIDLASEAGVRPRELL